MINREITYERNISSSYMKIPSVMEECFDEKLMLRRNYTGCIAMEKCFVNGQGQYWYNITGKQALDAYCRVNAMGFALFETLILRICNQLEVLEWNLIDSNCLMVDPELIFVNNRGEDISFILYPDKGADFFQDFQQLMEYLLTKLNHGEKEAVHAAYKIYEITLSDGYNMSDIKEAVLAGKQKEEVRAKNEDVSKRSSMSAALKEPAKTSGEYQKKKENESVFFNNRTNHNKSFRTQKSLKNTENSNNIKCLKNIENKYSEMIEKLKKFLSAKPEELIGKKVYFEQEEKIPTVVYPDEEVVKEQIEIHPTVCLTAAFGEPRGLLIYEGIENYTDFDLEQFTCLIGKNERARMHIERETISQFHAKIDYIENNYYIEDLNSTNGTYVNDEILSYKERKILQSGDVIRFADIKYRFL